MSDEDVVEVDDSVDAGEELDSEVDSSADIAVESEPQAEAPQQDVWGAFKQLPQFQGADDRAIASRLYEALQREQSATHALQQYQSTIPVVSEYLQKKELFDAWLQQQNAERTGGYSAPQQRQQQPAEEEPSWWNPPKIREAYKQYLTKDEQGRDIIDPAAPLDARHALTEYLQHRAEFARKLLDNPQEALGPMMEKVAQQRAQDIVSQHVAQMKEESYVSSLEQQNADWLYDRNGNVSPEGLAVQKYIQDARQLGIQGAQARWDYATRMVERDLLVANLQTQHQQMQYQQQPAPQQMPAAPSPADTKAQQNMEYLRQQAMRTASQRPAASTNARVPNKPMTFAEKLAANLQSEGLTSY